MHPWITVFSHEIAVYDLMTLGGIILAVAYLSCALRSLGLRHIPSFLILGFIVQDVGGMIIPYSYRWIYLGETPWSQGAVTPGRYFHSVFLSVLIFTLFACRLWKWPTKKVIDHIAIAAMIASAVGRIGCFFEGCCAGKFSQVPWALRFPGDTASRHPAQLYMLGIESALVFYLFYFNRSGQKKYDGETFWRGVFLYSVYRFLIEFVRVNPVFIYGLTHAQVFSVMTFALSLTVLLKKRTTVNLST